jgi:hypothetical protein
VTPAERLRLHQEEPQCASCHRRIDPIGLGLENFDAIGQWRTSDSYKAEDSKDAKTWSIEPAGALYGGPAFADFHENLNYLRKTTFPQSRSLDITIRWLKLGSSAASRSIRPFVA